MIIKKSSKNKLRIKLSREEWYEIGKGAGWLKNSVRYDRSRFDKTDSKGEFGDPLYTEDGYFDENGDWVLPDEEGLVVRDENDEENGLTDLITEPGQLDYLDKDEEEREDEERFRNTRLHPGEYKATEKGTPDFFDEDDDVNEEEYKEIYNRGHEDIRPSVRDSKTFDSGDAVKRLRDSYKDEIKSDLENDKIVDRYNKDKQIREDYLDKRFDEFQRFDSEEGLDELEEGMSGKRPKSTSKGINENEGYSELTDSDDERLEEIDRDERLFGEISPEEIEDDDLDSPTVNLYNTFPSAEGEIDFLDVVPDKDDEDDEENSQPLNFTSKNKLIDILAKKTMENSTKKKSFIPFKKKLKSKETKVDNKKNLNKTKKTASKRINFFD